MTPRTIQDHLETPYWIDTVETDTSYARQHDDTDGGPKGFLQVTFDRMGDAYVSIDGDSQNIEAASVSFSTT